MLNLYQLQTFVTVVSEGSMTAAADKLYLTQPAVSQQIRALEEELGVELLVRGVRQIKATPQGEILFEQARRLLQMMQQTEVAIKSIGAELKGQIRIGTLSSLGLHVMSPIVSRLMRHNPELMIKIQYETATDLIRDYKKGQLDVLILPDTQTEYQVELEGSEQKLLHKEELWLVSSGKEMDVPHQIQLKEINELPFIHFTDEYPHFNSLLQTKLQAFGLQTQAIFECSNVGTLKRVIESGLGWGFLPANSIRKQVKLGRMTRTFIEDFNYSVDHYFYYQKKNPQKSLLEVFYQALSAQKMG